MTEGETEDEVEMKTKLKQDKEAFVFRSLPIAVSSKYFVNKSNPVPDYEFLNVMWLCLQTQRLPSTQDKNIR